MKKRILSLVLALIMVCTLLPSNAFASNAYYINGKYVHWDDYGSSPNECWVYAQNIYNKIWGTSFSSYRGTSDDSLRNLSMSELTLTEAHLKAYVSNAAVGSCLRICNSEYFDGGDGWGHSQIIVQKDSGGFTVFEGGLSAYPYCREKYYTWSEYINTGWLGGTYSYIKYIKWPGADAYGSSASTNTPGKPVLKDFSRYYAHGAITVFNWDSTENTTHYNLYIDRRNTDGTWETDYRVWHYAVSGFSAGFEDGIYRVRLQSTNSNADGWPYTNANYIIFAVGPHTHEKGKFAFYEADHPHCNCYECSFCAKIWKDTSSSNELENCYYCQRPEKPALKNFKTDYTYGETTVFDWNSTEKTTHYNLYIDRQNTDGTWEKDYRVWHYAVSGLSAGFEVGTYRVLLQATNNKATGKDGTGWAYTNADYITFVVNEKQIVMTATFDANGGSVTQTSKTVTKGSNYGTLPTPTQTNYVFDGWYTSATDGNKVTADTIVSKTTNHSLYAHWTYICALGHNYKDGVCTVCGEKDPNYKPPVYPFTDVDTAGRHAPFADAIRWAANEGITTGYGDGIFKPNLDCSRAQVVTFLWRAAGEPTPKSAENPFVDVAAKQANGKDNPFYTAILWAVGEGITNGVDSTHFAPDATVTRAQFVTFLWRYENKPAATPGVTLTDISTVTNADFKAAILWAAGEGITTGYPDGSFRPNAGCTRAHVVTFIYRDLT